MNIKSVISLSLAALFLERLSSTKAFELTHIQLVKQSELDALTIHPTDTANQTLDSSKTNRTDTDDSKGSDILFYGLLLTVGLGCVLGCAEPCIQYYCDDMAALEREVLTLQQRNAAAQPRPVIPLNQAHEPLPSDIESNRGPRNHTLANNPYALYGNSAQSQNNMPPSPIVEEAVQDGVSLSRD